MQTELVHDMMKLQLLFQFITDVARLALGFGLGMFIALRFTRRRGDIG